MLYISNNIVKTLRVDNKKGLFSPFPYLVKIIRREEQLY